MTPPRPKTARRTTRSIPLVQNGKKLIPSVNRVFSTTREIYVYFQAYKQQPAATAPPAQQASARQAQRPRLSQQTKPAPQPLFAFVTLYQGDNKVYDTPPTAIVPNPNQPPRQPCR
jgi:hypothetical protein